MKFIETRIIFKEEEFITILKGACGNWRGKHNW